ncbi:MAG: hypothetical protein Q9170_005676 [Blastenia crenularia]
MPVSTRHKSALRRAEGLPPSPTPQNPEDLPRELRQRPRYRSRRVARSTATPESEEDPAPNQNLNAPAQALREGNAGGYVVQSTSEQQDSLPHFPPSSPAPLQVESSDNHGQHGPQESASAAGIISSVTPIPGVYTPSPSSTCSPSSTSQLFKDLTAVSKSALLPKASPKASPQEEQAKQVKPVSTQTDGYSPTATPVIIPAPPKITRPSMCTASMQTDALADRFRPLGLYDFRSELAVPPESCRLTLHLGAEREIRIFKVPSAALDEIKNILHSHDIFYERNWLTCEEAAAETADAVAAGAAKKSPSSNKRKRDDATAPPHSAQRRRVEVSPTIAPTPPKPFRLRSRFRTKSGSSSQSQAAGSLMRQVNPNSQPPKSTDRSVNYRRDGSLRLLSMPKEDHPSNGSDVRSVSQMASTTDSDEEGESEEILLFPSLASANRAMLGQSTNEPARTTSQTSSNTLGPMARDAEGTSPATTNPPAGEELTTPVAETRQTSTWGLGSLFNTARRLIPSIGRQRAPLAVPQTNRPTVHSPDMLDGRVVDISHRGTRTESRRQEERVDQVTTEPTSNFAQRLRESQSATQRTFRSKETIEEIKKIKAEKERLRAEWAKLEEERRNTEEERKDIEDAHRAAYASQHPGSKRSRISPRVIPNPKGVSYGLDPNYFDSSDEEEEEPSPLRQSHKRPRLYGPERSKIDEQNASFNEAARTSSGSEALQYRGSRFSDSAPNIFDVHTAHADSQGEASKDVNSATPRLGDPGFNRMGHFQVPLSPTSSEEDEFEDENGDEAENQSSKAPVTEKAMSSPTKKATSGGQVANNLAATASTSTTLPPPQPPMTPGPNQGTRTVRFAEDYDPGRTLEQNRQKLRADLAAKAGAKSVLSPKDIVASPVKKTRAPIPDFGAKSTHFAKEPSVDSSAAIGAGADTGSNQDASVQPAVEEDFNIRGSANRKAPKSPKRLLAETLPSIHQNVDKLQAYTVFQQEMDPAVRELLESSWVDDDDVASTNDFEADLKVHRTSEQSEVPVQATPAVPKTQGPFVDDPEDFEDDHEFLYDDEKATYESQKQTGKALNAVQPTSAGNDALDPTVIAFMETSWSHEDEAYASDEFKEYYAINKEAEVNENESKPSSKITA